MYYFVSYLFILYILIISINFLNDIEHLLNVYARLHENFLIYI